MQVQVREGPLIDASLFPLADRVLDKLPITVLNKIFEENNSLHEFKNYNAVCKSFHQAVNRVAFVQNAFQEERDRREAQRREQLRQRRQRRVDVCHNFAHDLRASLLILLPGSLMLAMGLTGIIYFTNLNNAVSIIPNCDGLVNMMIALYFSCGFWVANFFLFFTWAVSAHLDRYAYEHESLRNCRLNSMFAVCNGIGVLTNAGIWTSAAAAAELFSIGLCGVQSDAGKCRLQLQLRQLVVWLVYLRDWCMIQFEV